jgi:hypothetical protein
MRVMMDTMMPRLTSPIILRSVSCVLPPMPAVANKTEQSLQNLAGPSRMLRPHHVDRVEAGAFATRPPSIVSR